MKMISRISSRVGSFVVVVAMSGLLVACGGGTSGDGVPLDEQDADNDGTINSQDADADGDGITDTLDNFVDLDGDGLDDLSGETEAQANAGSGDNVDNSDVTETNPCGIESGTDNNSSTSTWGDNCYIRRTSSGGQFADSFYAVGIQRVLFCEGYGSGDLQTFADGEYGPISEAALKDFQRAEGLVDDGIVGAQTWARLQEKLDSLSLGQPGVTPDVFGFASGVCAGIPLFYQYTTVGTGAVAIPGRWELSRNPPNTTQTVPFSIESAARKL